MYTWLLMKMFTLSRECMIVNVIMSVNSVCEYEDHVSSASVPYVTKFNNKS